MGYFMTTVYSHVSINNVGTVSDCARVWGRDVRESGSQQSDTSSCHCSVHCSQQSHLLRVPMERTAGGGGGGGVKLYLATTVWFE